MSQTCIKCSKDVDHDISVCPKNYVGSSKGMEATGSARITKHLFETGKVVIAKHVGDDNSSCRMVMHHPFQELIDAGKLELADWPQYHGKLKEKKQRWPLTCGSSSHRIQSRQRSLSQELCKVLLHVVLEAKERK